MKYVQPIKKETCAKTKATEVVIAIAKRPQHARETAATRTTSAKQLHMQLHFLEVLHGLAIRAVQGGCHISTFFRTWQSKLCQAQCLRRQPIDFHQVSWCPAECILCNLPSWKSDGNI